jgi:hypothetical protein
MFRALGRIVIVLVVGVALFVGWSFLQDYKARAFIRTSVAAICKRWDFDELKRLSSTKLRATPVFENQGQAMMYAMGQALGPIKSAEEPAGTAGLRFDTRNTSAEQGTQGSYVVYAHFERGEAEIKIHVVRENGLWRIATFNVNSPQFRENPLTRPKLRDTI